MPTIHRGSPVVQLVCNICWQSLSEIFPPSRVPSRLERGARAMTRTIRRLRPSEAIHLILCSMYFGWNNVTQVSTGMIDVGADGKRCLISSLAVSGIFVTRNGISARTSHKSAIKKITPFMSHPKRKLPRTIRQTAN